MLYTRYGLTQAFDSFVLLNRAQYFHVADGTRVIVEVKLDKIPVGVIGRMQQVNREGFHANEYTDALQTAVVDALTQMKDLKALEQSESSEITETYTVPDLWDDSDGSGKFITVLENVPGAKEKPAPPKRNWGGYHPEKPAIPVSEPPTYIEWSGTIKAINLHKGKPAKMRFETDADRKKYTFKNGALSVMLFDAQGNILKSPEVQITKTLLKQSGRGFVEIVYTGEQSLKRIELGYAVMFVETGLQQSEVFEGILSQPQAPLPQSEIYAGQNQEGTARRSP